MLTKKCPKTMSGKHKWGEYYDGIKDIKTTEIGTLILVPKIAIHCEACGMVDDRPKKK